MITRCHVDEAPHVRRLVNFTMARIIAVTSSSEPKGPHRLRPIESTLRNLTQMKNAARKLLESVSRGRPNTSKFCQNLIVWEFSVPIIQLN